MNTSVKCPQAMLDRLILTKEQLSNRLPEHMILVTCNDVWNTTDVELSLFAPGINDAKVRGMLITNLQHLFVYNQLFNEWVVGVKMEGDDFKVIIEINEPRHQQQFIDMVIGTVPALLAPKTIDGFHDLCVMRESQKLALVQLTDPYDSPSHSFDLTFPAEIELHDDGMHLQDHLVRSVRAFSFVRDVFVYRKDDQRVVSVPLNWDRHRSDRRINDMLKKLIAAYASQAKVDGRSHELVFLLDRPFVDIDDGGDYEQRPLEY